MNCYLIDIKTVNGAEPDLGRLSFFEANKDIFFDIKRIYYISDVEEGITRGFHAHKTLNQLLFCPYGSIEITADDGNEKQTFLLDSPSKGLVVTSNIWRTMKWIQRGSVLCVAASDYYNEDDYIRDYDAFLNYVKGD